MDFVTNYGLWSLPFLWILHEGGHWLTSKILTGKGIDFYWDLEYYIIPVGHWYMDLTLPQDTQNKIWASGFIMEFLPWIFMPVIYKVTSVVHFVTYFWRYSYGEAEYWKRLLKGFAQRERR